MTASAGVEQLYTVAEVAAILRVGVKTVQRWISEDRLAAHRVMVGGSWRIKASDLQRSLDGATTEVFGPGTAG
jgi:excisionase family DNA binding protein